MSKNEAVGNGDYWMAEWRDLGGTWDEKENL